MGTLAPYIAPSVSVLVTEDQYEAATELIRSRNGKILTDTVQSFPDTLQRIRIGETYISFASRSKVYTGSDADMRIFENIECKAIRVGSEFTCISENIKGTLRLNFDSNPISRRRLIIYRRRSS